MKKKMHKLDSIFLIGILIIGIIGGMLDGFGNINFPVFTCYSAVLSYGFWIILLIYSSLKYKEKTDKPEYVRWYMYFALGFIHIIFSIPGLIISQVLKNILNL